MSNRRGQLSNIKFNKRNEFDKRNKKTIDFTKVNYYHEGVDDDTYTSDDDASQNCTHESKNNCSGMHDLSDNKSSCMHDLSDNKSSSMHDLSDNHCVKCQSYKSTKCSKQESSNYGKCQSSKMSKYSNGYIDSCNNGFCPSPSNNTSYNQCGNKKNNCKTYAEKMNYRYKANMRIRELELASKLNEYNPLNAIKLNNGFLTFSKEELSENIQYVINAYENIACSVYKYKHGIENLINNLIDSIELTKIDIDVTIKNLSALQNVFINEFIMLSKEKLTNCKSVLSLYVFRNTNNDGFNNCHDNSTVFSNLITKPNKFGYYLKDGNILTLFNLGIFGINLNDHNNLVIQTVNQQDSVATVHKNSKIETRLFSFSPNIKNIKFEFNRDVNGDIVEGEKYLNIEKSLYYLISYLNSIIDEHDIYQYEKSDLNIFLNEINSDIEKLKFIKKTVC